jgi:ribonuclease HI
MILKKGIDLVLHSINDYYIINIKTFPVSLYGNQPYRNSILEDLSFKINRNENTLEDAIDVIFENLNKIKLNDQCNFIFYTTEGSLEHNILDNSEHKDSIQFHGCKIKRDKLKDLKDNYLEKSVKEKEVNEKDYKNFIFFDFDLNTEELFKTHEITIARYDSFEDLNAENNFVFENHYITNSLKKSNHDWFIDLAEPHIKMAYEEGKKVYFQAKSYHMPYIYSLNNALAKQGLEKVAIKRKNNPLYKIKKELSYERIRKHMIEKYDDLTNLEDKYVVYCDGASVVMDEGILNSSAFIFREKDANDFEFVKRNISQDKNNQVYAEVNALVFSINHIINVNKTDKPIHFVFDSDYVFKSFEATLNKNYDRVSEKCKDIFSDIEDKIEKYKLNLQGIVLKGHQLSDHNNKKHEVILYNEKVDQIASKNLFHEAKKIDFNKKNNLKIN